MQNSPRKISKIHKSTMQNVQKRSTHRRIPRAYIPSGVSSPSTTSFCHTALLCFSGCLVPTGTHTSKLRHHEHTASPPHRTPTPGHPAKHVHDTYFSKTSQVKGWSWRSTGHTHGRHMDVHAIRTRTIHDTCDTHTTHTPHHLSLQYLTWRTSKTTDQYTIQKSKNNPYIQPRKPEQNLNGS